MKYIIYTMAVFNTEKYIEDAIDSLLKSFNYANSIYKDIKGYLIIRNDGSTDKSKEVIINKMKEHNNIIYYENDKNIGILETRRNLFEDVYNFVNENVKDDINKIYVGILDSDDICPEDKIYNQIKVLLSDDDLKGCGGQALFFRENENELYNSYGIMVDYKKQYEEIKVESLFQSSVLSGYICLKYTWLKNKIENFERKYWWSDVRIGEDWKFIVNEMSDPKFKFCNVEDVVLYYRRHDKGMTNYVTDGLNTDQAKIREKALSYINLKLTNEEHLLYICISPCRYWGIFNVNYFHENQKNIYESAKKLLDKITKANEKNNFYSQKYLNKYCQKILENVKKYETLNLENVPILLKIN